MPRGVYQRTKYHRERLTGRKGATGKHSRIGHCDECGKETTLYQVEIAERNPREGLKHNWICLPCARSLHRQGKLIE